MNETFSRDAFLCDAHFHSIGQPSKTAVDNARSMVFIPSCSCPQRVKKPLPVSNHYRHIIRDDDGHPHTICKEIKKYRHTRHFERVLFPGRITNPFRFSSKIQTSLGFGSRYLAIYTYDASTYSCYNQPSTRAHLAK